jgi:hypothetical protein
VAWRLAVKITVLLQTAIYKKCIRFCVCEETSFMSIPMGLSQLVEEPVTARRWTPGPNLSLH